MTISISIYIFIISRKYNNTYIYIYNFDFLGFGAGFRGFRDAAFDPRSMVILSHLYESFFFDIFFGFFMIFSLLGTPRYSWNIPGDPLIQFFS